MSFGFGLPTGLFDRPLMGDDALRLDALGLPQGFGGPATMAFPSQQAPGANDLSAGNDDFSRRARIDARAGTPTFDPSFALGSIMSRAVPTGRNPFDLGQAPSAPAGGPVPLPPMRPGDASLMADVFEPPAPRRSVPAGSLPDAATQPLVAPAFTSLRPGGAAPPVPSPSMPSVASAPAAEAPSEGIGDMLGRFRTNGGFDMLGAIGMGLLSSPTWAGGLASGLAYNDQQEGRRALLGERKVDSAIKVRKVQREVQGENATVALLERNGYPRETASALVLAAAAGNREGLNNAMSRISPKAVDAPSGYTVDPATGRGAFIPGGPADPSTVSALAQARAGEQAPVVRDFTVGGVKVPRVLNRATGQWEQPDYGSNPPTVTQGDGLDVPPGVDPATYRKELAKATVAQQKAATGRAAIAESMTGVLDRAERAYTKLGELNAIGPISASGLNRAIGGAFGREAEVLRQDYEAAAKELELAKAQISMKGQGTITDSERRLLALTLPRLDAADSRTGLTTLQGLRRQYQGAVNAETLPTYGRGRGQGMAVPPASAVQHLRQAAAASRMEALARTAGMTVEEAVSKLDAPDQPSRGGGFADFFDTPYFREQMAERERERADRWREVLAEYGSEEAVFAPGPRERALADAVERFVVRKPTTGWSIGSLCGWDVASIGDPAPEIVEAIQGAYAMPVNVREAWAEFITWHKLGRDREARAVAAGDHAPEVQFRTVLLERLLDTMPAGSLRDLRARMDWLDWRNDMESAPDPKEERVRLATLRADIERMGARLREQEAAPVQSGQTPKGFTSKSQNSTEQNCYVQSGQRGGCPHCGHPQG